MLFVQKVEGKRCELAFAVHADGRGGHGAAC